MQKKRGLGKGFGEMAFAELLGERPVALVEDREKQTPVEGELSLLKIDQLRPGRYQPRQTIQAEALEELANSIRAQGIIQPIVVREIAQGQYEIIAGERRWRAAQLADLVEVPVVIRDLPDRAVIAMSLIENIQRQDLNAIEEAVALQRLITEFDMTHQNVADAVGKSRVAVTNLLRLLNLNPEVRHLLEKGQLEMGHGRALLGLDPVQQTLCAHKIIKQALSVRQTEQLVQQQQQVRTEKAAPPRLDPDIARLQNTLSEKLKAHVQIKHSAQGKGTLIFHYHSVDELQGLLDQILPQET